MADAHRLAYGTIQAVRFGITGLLTEVRDSRTSSTDTSLQLCSPTAAQRAASTDCRVCREEFGKTGPVCDHCKQEEVVSAYSRALRRPRRDAISAGSKKKRKSRISQAAALVDETQLISGRSVQIEYAQLVENVALQTLLWLSRAVSPAEVAAQVDGGGSAGGGLAQLRMPQVVAALVAESQAVKDVWRHQANVLSVYDTLHMVCSRMRYLEADEEASEHNEVSDWGRCCESA